MRYQHNKKVKKSLALLLILALLAGILPMGNNVPVSEAAGYGVSAPRTDSTGTVTWDCVWFGNYWQEDTNEDGTADKDDAKQPIKWRVLSVDGDDAFLVADQNLDVQKYNDTYTDVTWETCTMRSWLNGYGASSNVCEKDYTDNNFMDNAFTPGEQAAIKTTTVVNEDNPDYGTKGGNDTQDKVYLLSIGEVKEPAYGFSSDRTKYDKGRRAKNTDYAKAQGAYTNTSEEYAGNGGWWLRSPGSYSDYASSVDSDGYVNSYGSSVYSSGCAVRPALHLNLSSNSGWSYAGTVSSDGGATGQATPAPAKTQEPAVSQVQTKLADALPDFDDLGSAEIKGPEIKIGKNRFNLFKTKCNMSLPIFDNTNLQIKVNETDHTAEVLLGMEGEIASDPDDPYWSETYQQVKSLVKACGGKTDTTKLWNRFSKLRGKLKKLDGDAVFKVGGNAAGFIKLQLDENYNPVQLIEGGVMAGLEASGKVKTPLWWIVYSEFGVGGSVDGKLSLTTENTKTIQVQGELGLAINPSIALGADAVVVDVKGGIEGELGGSVTLPWKSFEECVSAWLSGKLFVKVDTIVPGLSGGYDFEFPKLELYPELGKIDQKSLDMQYTLSTQPTKREVRGIKRYASGAVDTAKQSLVYENAKPEMVTLPDGRILMTYLDDTVPEADGQAKLMYRLYENGTWSDGTPVNKNTNLDMAGKLCVYGGKAYVLYENSRQAVTEEMTQEEILNSMDLYAVSFDPDTATFAEPIRLGEVSGKDSAWKYGYDFAADDSALSVVWAENSEGDILLERGNTDFYESRLSETGWQEKSSLYSEAGTVQEFCVQKMDGASHLIYIKDGVLYMDGEACEFSQGKADSVKLFDGILYVRLGGHLYRWSNGEAVPLGVACTTSYRVMGDTVYWTEQDNFTSEIYKKDCSSENAPVAVTDEGGYIGSFSLLGQQDGTPLLAYTLQKVNESVESGSPYGLTLLKFSEELSRNQAEVTNVAYDVLSYTPGTQNDIAVTVANTGTTELTQVKVTLSDDEGNALHEEVVSVSLNPGEVLEKHLSVLIPENLSAGKIHAAVSADQSFASPETGTAKLDVEMAQADISVAVVDNDTISIVNQAEQAAEQVVLTIKDRDETGTVLRSENIGSLAPGERKEVSVEDAWSDTTLNSATGQHYLYCDVTQETMEYALWDNSLQLQKEADKIPQKPTASPTATGSPTPVSPVPASPTPASPLPASPLPASPTPVSPLPTTPTLASPTPVATPPVSSGNTGTGQNVGTSGSGGASSSASSTLSAGNGDSANKVSAPAKVSLTSVKNKKKKSFTAVWKKVSGANGYEIQYALNKKFTKGKKKKLTKKTKLTVKKLKKKQYFVRVRAYVLQNGKKVYGAWSKVKKVKMKK